MSETVSAEELKQLAKLANLPLDQKQAPKLLFELNKILEYVSSLQQLDTNRVDPTAEITGLTNVYQTDGEQPCLSAEQALSSAPQAKGGYVVVKGVFEESNDV